MAARFAGGLDTERGPLGLSSRAPRSVFKEAASQGFLEAVSFYYSPRPMFRPVISASSSSLRSLPAPGWALWPRAPGLPSDQVPQVLLFLPALASIFLASRSSHPPGQLLCSPVPLSLPALVSFLVSRPGHPPASFFVPLSLPIPGQPLWPIILYIFVVSLDYWA